MSQQEEIDPIWLLAAMNPEAEAWRIVAFVPRNEDERARLVGERSRLTFDPQLEPDRLDSTSAHNRDRSPKACLDRLIGGDGERSAATLEEPLDRLRETPAVTGLPDYLRDIAAALRSMLDRFLAPS